MLLTDLEIGICVHSSVPCTTGREVFFFLYCLATTGRPRFFSWKESISYSSRPTLAGSCKATLSLLRDATKSRDSIIAPGLQCRDRHSAPVVHPQSYSGHQTGAFPTFVFIPIAVFNPSSYPHTNVAPHRQFFFAYNSAHTIFPSLALPKKTHF